MRAFERRGSLTCMLGSDCPAATQRALPVVESFAKKAEGRGGSGPLAGWRVLSLVALLFLSVFQGKATSWRVPHHGSS